ncbi:putative epidermal cell surface receptor isoform X3 [Varroa destructor]|uniref:Epidermal cell surface receptor n=1 Tax=Varroa destructor TaxID=109461 RepID=A0A7M7M988_VARDE|nr:putative epidermal cell surface receptor isoform X3 [Varroa destructor]
MQLIRIGVNVLTAAMKSIIVTSFLLLATTAVQTSQDIQCACDSSGVPDNSVCPTRKMFSNANKHCKTCSGATCTRLSGQSCGENLHCEADFGLACDPLLAICKGKLQIIISNVTSHSAELRWKLRKKVERPAGIFYSAKYDGANTAWSGALVNKDGDSVTLRSLRPKHEYVVKVMQDNTWEMTVVQTPEDTSLQLPQLKTVSRSANTITLAWDDFDSTNKYTIEYRPSDAKSFDAWTKVKASGSFSAIKDLVPGSGYLFQVRNQENFVSDSLLVFTEDGCSRQGKSYRVGATFFEGCSLRCVCRGSDNADCEPRCPVSSFGNSIIASPSHCHQVPSANDSCCVSVHCEHGKPGNCPSVEYNVTVEECLHECHTDLDCLGEEKCCHRDKCGVSVCISPIPEPKTDDCTVLSCGPNTFCLLAHGKASCECLKGYSGNPRNTRVGCDKFTPNIAPTDPGVCSYKDKRYPVGEEFEDECLFRCHCSDRFEVECRQRCPTLPTWTPVNCHLIKDPKDACCNILACEHPRLLKNNANNKTDNFGLSHAVSTLRAHPASAQGCEYNGHRYEPNEDFDNGCESRCSCIGGGHVACEPRCHQEIGDSDDSNCVIISHPVDSCCKILSCPDTPGEAPLKSAQDIQLIVEQVKIFNESQLAVGFIARAGQQPPSAQVWFKKQSDNEDRWVKRKYKLTASDGYLLDVPGLEANTAYLFKVVVSKAKSNTVRARTSLQHTHRLASGCLHNNQTYEVGQHFDIGCEERCVCERAGMVECQKRCKVYVDIVGYQHCRFEDSPDDRCCKVPVCDSANHPNDDYDDSSVGKASSHGRTFGFPEFNVTCSDHTGLPHKVGETFFHDCHEKCICQVNGKALCRPLECHRDVECSAVDSIDSSDFVPKPPNCCPPTKCKSGISDEFCIYNGEKFRNFQQIPQRLVERCDQRCVCVNGAVTCEHRCQPANSIPPPTLPCPLSLAYRGYLPGDTCCTHWMCPIADTELRDVSVVALNSTTVRVRFMLPTMLVGQTGHSEVHYSTEREKDRNEWEVQRFVPPGEIFERADVENFVSGLKPKTGYVFQIIVDINSMREHPRSAIVAIETPDVAPSLVRLDMRLELATKDSTIRVEWRPLTMAEKELVDGVKVKYRRADSPAGLWQTSQLLHRDITSYQLERVQPNKKYTIDLEFVSKTNARIVSEKSAKILTPNDDFSFKITLSPEQVNPESASILLQGVPSPVSKFVQIVHILRESNLQRAPVEIYQKLREAKISLDGLQPSTTYKVRLEAFLNNGDRALSNTLELRTPDGARKGHHESAKRTLQIALLVIIVLGLLVLVGFAFAWSHLASRRPKGAPDLTAYDNPTYKVEMTTINNNGPRLTANGQGARKGHLASGTGTHSHLDSSTRFNVI